MERARVVVAGCGATGIMDGLAMGRLAAELAAGARPCLDITTMDPGRFGRRYASRTTLRAAQERVYRTYYGLRGGRV